MNNIGNIRFFKKTQNFCKRYSFLFVTIIYMKFKTQSEKLRILKHEYYFFLREYLVADG